VLSILTRVFHERADGTEVSLSGKPVIISYLLELVEDLKKNDAQPTDRMSEWGVYELIISRLMDREFKQRTHVIFPSRRREFLQRMSIHLSLRSNPALSEDQFRDLIRTEFATELKRALPEEREAEVERYFGDLRSSATLTRASEAGRNGWKFSHNSLREFLAAESLIHGLVAGRPLLESVPVSEPMRRFVASHGDDEIRGWLIQLAPLVPQAQFARGVGQLLGLLWDAGLRLGMKDPDPVRSLLRSVFGDGLVITGLSFERLRLPAQNRTCVLDGCKFVNCQFSDCDFSGASFRGSKFIALAAENVSFANADLQGADFNGGLLIELDMSGANLDGANFVGLVGPPIILTSDADPEDVKRRLEGMDAVGYLNYAGAITDDVPAYYIQKHNPLFPVIEKVCRKLMEQTWVQKLGLVKKGASRQDPKAASEFLNTLISNGFVEENPREQISATPKGREIIVHLLEKNELAPVLQDFLQSH